MAGEWFVVTKYQFGLSYSRHAEKPIKLREYQPEIVWQEKIPEFLAERTLNDLITIYQEYGYLVPADVRQS